MPVRLSSSAELKSRALAAIPPPTPQYRKPRLTPGRVAYLLYHAPKGAFQKGVGKMLRGWRSRRALNRALPGVDLREPPALEAASPLDVHLLIGARYLPDACLLSHSLAWAAQRPVVPHFYDDGTLTPAECDLLRAKLPRARFTLIDEINVRLEASLPESKFPCLRRLRPAYPHIRKLTDIHLFPGEWKLVSDADILFFQHPAELLDHLTHHRALHMVDVGPAYGAPHSTLETLAGCVVHPQVNVGLCHLQSSEIDWDFVEHCAATILADHGFSYYLEQALTAILLARAHAVPLGSAYIVRPDKETARRGECAALHYVADSRQLYYDTGWPQIIARSSSSPARSVGTIQIPGQ